MGSDPLLPHVRVLLAERIESVVQLELLLFLFGRRERPWSPADVSAELRVSLDWTRGQLERLTKLSLLLRENDEYRYAAPPDLDKAITDLAQAYRIVPMTVVNAIYSPVDRDKASLRQFSDAFRLRREPRTPDEGKERPHG